MPSGQMKQAFGAAGGKRFRKRPRLGPVKPNSLEIGVLFRPLDQAEPARGCQDKVKTHEVCIHTSPAIGKQAPWQEHAELCPSVAAGLH